MPSTFGSMEISKTGMMTYNAAIQTTAHNIANIETKGYSRQTANYEALVANKSSSTVQGFGVGVVDITRERNEYYDNKFSRTQSTFTKYDTDQYYLNALQDLICGNVTSDDKSRIMDAFDDFYSSLSNLVGNPNNQTIRTEATTKAQTMAEYIQTMGENMRQLQDEANTEIKTTVDQINAIAKKIVSLNRQINVIESYGNKANDLRDQRSLLVDELSQYANVETLEKQGTITKKSGRQSEELVVDTQFYVFLNGNRLVDGYSVNEILYEQKETYSNINDIKGCYSLRWADGSDFMEHAGNLGGKLQSLFEMRDGNNSTCLEGMIRKVDRDAGEITFVRSETDKSANFIDDLDLLNIPMYDGELYINGSVYAYDSFTYEVEKNEDTGELETIYTFRMKDDLTRRTDPGGGEIKDILDVALESKMTVSAGEEVKGRGIPYYFAQLNEFIRTFSRRFNEIQNDGHDMYDEEGIDFFTAKTPTKGRDYTMIEEDKVENFSFDTALMDDESQGNYYYMNAANYKVAEEMITDPKKLACKTKIPVLNEDGTPKKDPVTGKTIYTSVGDDNWENVQKLSELKDDSSMFLHGAPDTFIQSLASSMGVEASRAEHLSVSQKNLLTAIDQNRQSVSGVDEDEEAENLMIFQQMLYNQYKALSVMNEVLDKLINGTAV